MGNELKREIKEQTKTNEKLNEYIKNSDVKRFENKKKELEEKVKILKDKKLRLSFERY